MATIKNLLGLGFVILFSCSISKAQNNEGQVHGNVQIDAQVYKTDSIIGAEVPPSRMGFNSYANLNYTKGNFTAGLRYEGYMNAMLGYDEEYNDVGIPIRYISYRSDELEITVGSFYDQFGNGLIFRSYEDKSLGYDNAMDGIKIKFNPYKGVYLKGFTGKQRKYFDLGPGIIRGIDGEFLINDIFESMSALKSQVILGGSFVSKYQKDENPVYNLPENVGAFSSRFTFINGGFNLNGEYAYKYPDPHPDVIDQYNYNTKFGDVILVNATYSRKGLGVFLSVKRVDNMSYRSDRNATLNNLNINFIPSITKNHTYALAAMYPYVTQPNGELGLQGEVIYNFKKETFLGGKYGTNLTVNFSQVNSLKTTPTANYEKYESEYLAIGDELYYRDLNVKVHKKINNKWKVDLNYLNLKFNNNILKLILDESGSSTFGMLDANILVADVSYKIKSRQTLRLELQGLFTEQDKGDWASGLLEYTLAPKWFLAFSDQYNYGNENDKVHYFNIAAGYKKKANRIQIGYGRQREGVVCIGGVCRNVPASSGFNISITSSF
ncbi:MAG: hypothetical protein C0597_13860 [Marinilabiliales bacterium]|nr:MAG: hypothetical protein C0597_13860 [Marinilabiliales bacterium]